MPPPARTPIGLHLSQIARQASRAFDVALAGAGGSRPVWLILVTLKQRRLASQRELADAVGIQAATLTHHLNAMEQAGLIARRRDPGNRRIHQVELTGPGEELFARLRGAATSFDARLRSGLSDDDLTRLRQLLDQLGANLR